MPMIATFQVGDDLVTLCSAQGIEMDKVSEEYPILFNLTFTDLVSGRTVTVNPPSEVDACRWFAAYIMADEPNNITKALAELTDTPAHTFLP
jgi:hypothetical protein